MGPSWAVPLFLAGSIQCSKDAPTYLNSLRSLAPFLCSPRPLQANARQRLERCFRHFYEVCHPVYGPRFPFAPLFEKRERQARVSFRPVLPLVLIQSSDNSAATQRRHVVIVNARGHTHYEWKLEGSRPDYHALKAEVLCFLKDKMLVGYGLADDPRASTS